MDSSDNNIFLEKLNLQQKAIYIFYMASLWIPRVISDPSFATFILSTFAVHTKNFIETLFYFPQKGKQFPKSTWEKRQRKSMKYLCHTW